MRLTGRKAPTDSGKGGVPKDNRVATIAYALQDKTVTWKVPWHTTFFFFFLLLGRSWHHAALHALISSLSEENLPEAQCSWTVTSCRPHRVTSGRVAHSSRLYQGATQRSFQITSNRLTLLDTGTKQQTLKSRKPTTSSPLYFNYF